MSGWAFVVIAQFTGGWVLYPPLSGAQQPTSGQPALTADVRVCIEGHAADVEKAIPSLTEATEFLVSKVCAQPIADQTAAEYQKMEDRQRAQRKAACDKNTNLKDAPSEEMCKAYLDMDFGNADYIVRVGGMTAWNSSPAASSLAAQTLLELRLQRSGARH